MTCVFVQIQCRPGDTYKVADEIAERELHAEMHSTSGEYDLLVKMYVPKGEDIGKFIGRSLHDIDGIVRTYTIITFSTI